MLLFLLPLGLFILVCLKKSDSEVLSLVAYCVKLLGHDDDLLLEFGDVGSATELYCLYESFFILFTKVFSRFHLEYIVSKHD